MAHDAVQPQPHDQSEQPQTGHPARGKLKIFLGYAAGVGKTYAMLDAARLRQDEGVDVVIGQVETHGRAEVEALTRSLEMIAPRTIEGDDAGELDLDAVLARRPQLVLVDNLAHTNAPGSRHTRRFQDIEELLSAGIDVYTTLNIQHLESLNDVVAQITGLTVRETVPDRLMDDVDSIELIDLPPDELIRRVREGKVALPAFNGQSVPGFFRPGNLTALRELALRRAAAQVDDEMRAYKKAHAIFYSWAATDRLLVCISANPLSERLVRAGRRLAEQANAEWFVVYVETPRTAHLSDTERDRIARTLRLAEELGASTVIVPGQSVADSILQYARAHNVTKIIVGKSLGAGWRDALRRSVVERIIQHSDEIDVFVISAPAAPIPRLPYLPPRLPDLRHALYSAGLVALVTLFGQFVHRIIEPTNLVMVYLLVVVIAATRWGRGPSLLAAGLSVLAFDFFIVPPRLTLAVSDAQYLLTFVGLFGTGMVISTLAAREREQMEAAQRRETYTAALYALSRDLATTIDLGVIVEAAIKHVSDLFNCEVAIFLPGDEGLVLATHSPDFTDEPQSGAVAAWVFQRGQMAGHGTETLNTARARYLPLKTAQSTSGVVSVRLNEADPPLNPDQERLLQALLSQAALAIEATQLAQNARQAQLLRETEKLQTALLNSVSHNLRTPLVSITGALSSLRDDAGFLDETAQRELLDTAWEEAERLNHLVGNLLNMTRLEAGAMRLGTTLCDVQDLVGVTLAQMSNRLRHRTVNVDVPGSLPPISIDLVLVAQALVNLVDNAIKYSPPDAPIEIRAYEAGPDVRIDVSDHGPGILPADLKHIFDKFYRVQRLSDVTGSGLGLSISQGIVELHNGRIWATNRENGGARFTIALPAASIHSSQENQP
ncbi:sensor histidine kinase [Aggregatilinea lenta]|uniref:sensor histidine kinase n=1 Tax=Aggregatilinea lenta TaxID=913108 RepID=UPI000E5A7E38|nr:sensor histidine kinase KdpD [Aggregatilinea lenta]